MYPEDYPELGSGTQTLEAAAAIKKDASPFEAALEEQRVALAAAHNELAHLQRKLVPLLRVRAEPPSEKAKENLADAPALVRIREMTRSARALGVGLNELTRNLVL